MRQAQTQAQAWRRFPSVTLGWALANILPWPTLAYPGIHWPTLAYLGLHPTLAYAGPHRLTLTIAHTGVPYLGPPWPTPYPGLPLPWPTLTYLGLPHTMAYISALAYLGLPWFTPYPGIPWLGPHTLAYVGRRRP